MNLFRSSETFKYTTIESLLKTYPQRKFILVGDSGEKDPEIYANIARRHGPQVRHIFIRNVSRNVMEENQLQTVFKGLPEGQWTIFRDTSALKQFEIE